MYQLSLLTVELFHVCSEKKKEKRMDIMIYIRLLFSYFKHCMYAVFPVTIDNYSKKEIYEKQTCMLSSFVFSSLRCFYIDKQYFHLMNTPSVLSFSLPFSFTWDPKIMVRKE